jgi:uncharacterized membrane protein
MSDDQGTRKKDRELSELLQELRVALPGIQVLLAFLLTIPFSQGWTKVTDTQKAVYYMAFVFTAIATAFFIAPVSYHRLRWREYDKEKLLVTGNRQAITASVFLALAIGAVTYLITDFIYGNPLAAVASAGIGGVIALLWYGLPLFRHVRDAG